MLLEAGLSAVAGVIVFVVSLAVRGRGERAARAARRLRRVLAILVQPRVFRPLAGWVLRKFGYTKELPDMRGRTISRTARLLRGHVGPRRLRALAAAALGRRASGGRVDRLPRRDAAVGAIVAVLFIFAPSGLGPREASMYGLMLAVATPGQALGAVALNRVALTLVELLVLFVGGLLLRGAEQREPAELTSV